MLKKTDCVVAEDLTQVTMEQPELTVTTPDGAESESESDPIVAPAAAPEAVAPRNEHSPFIVIKRTTFNYVFIAGIFLLLGVFIGWFSAFRVDRANRAWVTDAISAAMAEQADTFANLVASNSAPSLDDPDSRFDIAATSDYYRGSAAATVEMIEFGDFNCGFCGRFQAETFSKIVETYGDRVRFVYRDYPILADTSVTAALAARCAGEQGQFWEYHDLLFANQGTFNQAGAFAQYAGQLGLDVDEFNACVDEQRYLSGVVADYNEARDLGIRGTPAFFINGRPISGAQPFEVFAGVIDEELAANIDVPAEDTTS